MSWFLNDSDNVKYDPKFDPNSAEYNPYFYEQEYGSTGNMYDLFDTSSYNNYASSSSLNSSFEVNPEDDHDENYLNLVYKFYEVQRVPLPNCDLIKQNQIIETVILKDKINIFPDKDLFYPPREELAIEYFRDLGMQLWGVKRQTDADSHNEEIDKLFLDGYYLYQPVNYGVCIEMNGTKIAYDEDPNRIFTLDELQNVNDKIVVYMPIKHKSNTNYNFLGGKKRTTRKQKKTKKMRKSRKQRKFKALQ
jgi:hypothetical protein